MDFVHKSMGCALVLACLAAAPAQAGFKGVLNTPAMATQLGAQKPLNAVVASGSRLIAAGHRGIIIYSDDFGNSWKQAAVPVSSDLTSLYFISDRSGWAVGHDGVVLHTDDAGQSWQLQLDGDQVATLVKDYYGKKAQAGDARASALLPEIEREFSTGADKPFLDVWFANDKEGFVVGAFNMIFKTLDGGKNWTPLFERLDNPKRLHLYSIRGGDGRIYIAGEQGLLVRLEVGGERFETIPSTYTGSFFGVLPIIGGVVVYGMRGNAFHIPDKGGKWQKLETGVVGGLTGAANLGDGRLALVSTAGDVLVGNVGTGHFEKLKATRDMLFGGVAFVPATQSLASVGSAGASIVPLPRK